MHRRIWRYGPRNLAGENNSFILRPTGNIVLRLTSGKKTLFKYFESLKQTRKLAVHTNKNTNE